MSPWSTTSEPSSCLAHPVALNVVSTLWPLIRSPFHTVMPPTQKISQPQLISRTTAWRWLRPTSWLRLPVVIARRSPAAVLLALLLNPALLQVDGARIVLVELGEHRAGIGLAAEHRQGEAELQ